MDMLSHGSPTAAAPIALWGIGRCLVGSGVISIAIGVDAHGETCWIYRRAALRQVWVGLVVAVIAGGVFVMLPRH